ncbi:MAG TPA: FAD-binding oxidoreductase [Gaiellales bacterium]|nr:FAD-binding oxidoreductase [Gaiellales bacterium]
MSTPLSALERRYRQRSLWLDGLSGPLTPRPSLPGDTQCDVAIVGAGFTGLWAAYYLKQHQPDIRVVVVEREIAGYGPSGRNGGWVSSGISGSPAVYRKRGGPDAVRRAERETERTVDEIGRVVAAEGIECGFLKAGDLIVATTPPQRDRLLASARAERELGATDDDVRVLTPAQSADYARVAGCVAASYSPHAARVDPARLVRGLADACERLGVTIHERTAALEVDAGRVRCQGGTVRAETVLRATESYTTELPGESRQYLPLYSLMIATEPLPREVWEQLGWRDGLLVGDRHHLFFYAQRTSDGRIAIGGRGAPYRLQAPISEQHERSAAVRGRLERALMRHFPAASGAKITHHWGGPLAVPRDWSMSINYDRRTGLGSAGGYSGHGVVSANIGGRTLADLVLGRDTDLVSLPWVGHRSRRWEPEPLRFLASRAIVRVLESADVHEDTTGRRARRTTVLSPVMPPH